MTLANISLDLSADQINSLVPMLVFGLLVLVFALAIALSWLILSYRKAISKLTDYKQVQSKLVAKSQDQSMDIVNKAQQQALTIIASTNEFVRQSNQNFEKNLGAVSERELEALRQAVEAARQEILEVSKNISKDVSSATQTTFEQLRASYTQQLEKAFESTKADLEKYKKQKEEEIDKKVLAFIKDISAEVLGKSLTQRQHTQLVIKALEEARKKHVF